MKLHHTDDCGHGMMWCMPIRNCGPPKQTAIISYQTEDAFMHSIGRCCKKQQGGSANSSFSGCPVDPSVCDWGFLLVYWTAIVLATWKIWGCGGCALMVQRLVVSNRNMILVDTWMYLGVLVETWAATFGGYTSLDLKPNYFLYRSD